MQKIVYNTCFGGFGISEAAKAEMGYTGYDYEIDRDDPRLVAAVEKLGSENASKRSALLEIIEIPDDVEWQIEEYDGAEWVAEKHRTWPAR